MPGFESRAQLAEYTRAAMDPFVSDEAQSLMMTTELIRAVERSDAVTAPERFAVLESRAADLAWASMAYNELPDVRGPDGANLREVAIGKFCTGTRVIVDSLAVLCDTYEKHAKVQQHQRHVRSSVAQILDVTIGYATQEGQGVIHSAWAHPDTSGSPSGMMGKLRDVLRPKSPVAANGRKKLLVIIDPRGQLDVKFYPKELMPEANAVCPIAQRSETDDPREPVPLRRYADVLGVVAMDTIYPRRFPIIPT